MKAGNAGLVREALRAKPFACFPDTNAPSLFAAEDPRGPIRALPRRAGQRAPQTVECSVCAGIRNEARVGARVSSVRQRSMARRSYTGAST